MFRSQFHALILTQFRRSLYLLATRFSYSFLLVFPSMGGIPARNSKGERLLLYIGIDPRLQKGKLRLRGTCLRSHSLSGRARLQPKACRHLEPVHCPLGHADKVPSAGIALCLWVCEHRLLYDKDSLTIRRGASVFSTFCPRLWKMGPSQAVWGLGLTQTPWVSSWLQACVCCQFTPISHLSCPERYCGLHVTQVLEQLLGPVHPFHLGPVPPRPPMVRVSVIVRLQWAQGITTYFPSAVGPW